MTADPSTLTKMSSSWSYLQVSVPLSRGNHRLWTLEPPERHEASQSPFTQSCWWCCLVSKLCPTRWYPRDCSPPGPFVHGFPRQEYWSGLPCLSPGDLSDPRIKPISPALAGRFFTTEPPGKPLTRVTPLLCFICWGFHLKLKLYSYTCFWKTLVQLIPQIPPICNILWCSDYPPRHPKK